MIALNKIVKSYGENNVLCGLDFNLRSGQIICITGKNGAGKSTLLKIIMGHIVKFGGTYNNADKKISALIEAPMFMDWFSGRDNMEYLLDKKYLPRAVELANLFGLTEYIDKNVRKYSLGMRQKLALAIVFARDTDIYLLDEPFNSLDTETVTHMIDLIVKYKKEGKGIVVVTHNLSRIGGHCDSILQLKDGVLAAGEHMEDNETALVDYRLRFESQGGMNSALALLGDFAVKKCGAKSISVRVSRENLSVIVKRVVDCSLVGFDETKPTAEGK